MKKDLLQNFRRAVYFAHDDHISLIVIDIVTRKRLNARMSLMKKKIRFVAKITASKLAQYQRQNPR